MTNGRFLQGSLAQIPPRMVNPNPAASLDSLTSRISLVRDTMLRLVSVEPETRRPQLYSGARVMHTCVNMDRPIRDVTAPRRPTQTYGERHVAQAESDPSS